MDDQKQLDDEELLWITLSGRIELRSYSQLATQLLRLGWAETGVMSKSAEKGIRATRSFIVFIDDKEIPIKKGAFLRPGTDGSEPRTKKDRIIG